MPCNPNHPLVSYSFSHSILNPIRPSTFQNLKSIHTIPIPIFKFLPFFKSHLIMQHNSKRPATASAYNMRPLNRNRPGWSVENRHHGYLQPNERYMSRRIDAEDKYGATIRAVTSNRVKSPAHANTWSYFPHHPTTTKREADLIRFAEELLVGENTEPTPFTHKSNPVPVAKRRPMSQPASTGRKVSPRYDQVLMLRRIARKQSGPLRQYRDYDSTPIVHMPIMIKSVNLSLLENKGPTTLYDLFQANPTNSSEFFHKSETPSQTDTKLVFKDKRNWAKAAEPLHVKKRPARATYFLPHTAPGYGHLSVSKKKFLMLALKQSLLDNSA